MHFLAHGTHAYIHTISILLVHVDVPSAPGVVTGRRATRHQQRRAFALPRRLPPSLLVVVDRIKKKNWALLATGGVRDNCVA
jgi:hypothetical protein